jgi:hypothetical protein
LSNIAPFHVLAANILTSFFFEISTKEIKKQQIKKLLMVVEVIADNK